MKKILTYISNQVLAEATRLNTVVIFLKIISGIAVSKMIAIFIGPEGFALIGNMRNLLNAFQSLSIGGIYSGFVGEVSRVKHDVLKLSKTISTAYYIGFFITMLLALICYYQANWINSVLFPKYYNYAYIIKILAIALPFYALNMFSYAIMNGFSKYRMMLVINILGQIVGLLITLLLIYRNNVDGALIAVVLTPSLGFLITLVGFSNQRSLATDIKINRISLPIARKLAPYVMVALVTTVAMPITFIAIRNYITDHIGLKEAGYWEAMNRISDYYLMFVNSVMALYIIPKFRNIETKSAFKAEVKSFYQNFLPYVMMGLTVIYLLKPYIVRFVFSESFQPVESLFLWQLLGDLVKVLSTVIAFHFLAKKMFWHFIIIEVFLFLNLYVSSITLIDNFGLKGAVMGHFVAYLMQYGIILLIFSSPIFGVLTDEDEKL